MENIKMVSFKDITDSSNDARPMGHLTPIESKMDIPFDIKRIYYLTRVPENTIRGFHSHKQLQQVLVCLNGSVQISVSTPYEKEMITLDNPAQGLYIGPMIWREMYNFSPGSVLLVIASLNYDEDDYIRDYREYCELAKDYFDKREV